MKSNKRTTALLFLSAAISNTAAALIHGESSNTVATDVKDVEGDLGTYDQDYSDAAASITDTHYSGEEIDLEEKNDNQYDDYLDADYLLETKNEEIDVGMMDTIIDSRNKDMNEDYLDDNDDDNDDDPISMDDDDGLIDRIFHDQNKDIDHGDDGNLDENNDAATIKPKYKKEFVSRIVGGKIASTGEFPFMVGWYMDFNSNSYPSCGGSLISTNLVLTAAHCAGVSGGVRVGSINARSLYDGSPTGVEADVIREIMHPQYDASTTANDYMILELDQDIDTSIYTPITLNFDSEKPVSGDMLTVIGFGTLSSGGFQPDTLMKVDVPVVSHATCLLQYAGITEDIMLCAGYPQGGKDSCQGDSGGPIFKEINNVMTQVGIVSFGQGCALPGYSGVYSRLSGVSSWLKTEICNRSNEPKPSYCAGFEPTPLPPPPTPSPIYRPTSNCMDSPLSWHDIDGSAYNCEWYAEDDNCSENGAAYENNGKTANEACCACGGGVLPPPFLTQIPQVSPPIVTTPLPTPKLTYQPTSNCVDSPLDWHDIDGSTYNCEWYAEDDKCSEHGSCCENNAKTANEACCACGGGVDPPILTTPLPTPKPTYQPTPLPTPKPTYQPTSNCVDSPLGWHDGEGSIWDCEWYAEDANCSEYGDSWEQNGKTANEACCACGGGVDPSVLQVSPSILSTPLPTPRPTLSGF